MGGCCKNKKKYPFTQDTSNPDKMLKIERSSCSVGLTPRSKLNRMEMNDEVN